MNYEVAQKTTEGTDWDDHYRQGTPPWDTGRVASELVRVISEQRFKPCTVLEIGCGTGADAIYLARKRFEVTAVDISPIAIERARARAEQEDALLRFVQADVFRFGPTAGTFDLVYDAGFYHSIRQSTLEPYVDLLWRVTRPGSHYLALCGATGETAEGGPPQVSEEDIGNELGRLFEPVQVRPFRFESPNHKEGYAGWSCLMRRPVLGGRT
ncbi:MAG: class I SAM-dependent methyltransferase [Planctomycetota bacterium]